MAYIKMKKSLWDKHKNCDCYVERNYTPKQSKSRFNQLSFSEGHNPLPPALMCRNHNKWIKWLSAQEADDIELVLASNHV